MPRIFGEYGSLLPLWLRRGLPRPRTLVRSLIDRHPERSEGPLFDSALAWLARRRCVLRISSVSAVSNLLAFSASSASMQ